MHHLQLAKLYTKKSILISCPAAFGGKSWTQRTSTSNNYAEKWQTKRKQEKIT
ncbi:hypothetical protein G9A89_015165 [Geosiphon pyriformis]|nr:hypothetical protein G9A89_015165 [Geosiphon pyriformis]